MNISLKIKPNSKNNKIICDNDILKVQLKAAPIEGKANLALIKFLSKELKIPASLISIKKGLSSSQKILDIDIAAETWQNFLKKISKR